MRTFESLTEREILALAISLEEEDGRVYEDFAAALEANYPEQAAKFREMRQQEDGHRHRLLNLFRARFGEHVPLIRRQDVRGFVNRPPVWLVRPLGLRRVQKTAESMEVETGRFYEAVARRTTDAGIRQLLGDLAEEERHHAQTAEQISHAKLSEDEASRAKRLFLLQVVQPGLAGLMDGSVSTLAPLFAAAFATHSSPETFLVGMAAAVGAGISMGFAEALSDDGTLTGRGHPWARGFVCGGMTAVGGIGHTLPFLISNLKTATTIAVCVVLLELAAISWVRHRYMDASLASALLQVLLGGALVFLAGVLIGNS
ncbi:MAG: rubrerythrin [Verrucomicrobia bacterium]|nr:rubrerythrin [Verrucomicrobiota bacterium]MDE3099010.1 rubrerythrin [Verrucomicrobiota bacterium]